MNYYEILGLKSDASQEDIKKAYKKLIKKYHPDIYKGDKSFAEKKTAEINVAYDILSNSQTKQEYDNEHFQKTTINYNSVYDSNKTYYKSNYTNSQYNYQNYDFNRNRSSYYNSTKDGSEHDYSTYANYEKFYTDYHRSKTPNSNYDYNPNSFSNKIFNKTDNLSKTNKIRLVFIILFLYLVFLIFSVVDLLNFKDDYKNISPKNNITHSQSTQNKTNSEQNSSSDNYNIYEFFSKQEVKDLYNLYIEERNTYITFEQFEKILSEHLKSLTSF